MSTFSTSFQLQDFIENFQSRKLLLHNPINQLPITSAPPPYTQENNTFGENVLMIFLVLLCALICSPGLNYLIRFALRCTIFAASESSGNPSTNTGVKQKVLRTFSVVNYSVEMKLPGLDTECAICLAEFASGECIRLLPKCNHGFHVKCIDKWLKSNSSCPKCRDCLIKTCRKIVGCSEASSSESSLPAQESMVISIMPLEPEGFIRVYKGAT